MGMAVRGEAEFMLGLVEDIKAHWHKPKDGDFVSNREFANLIIGTIGSGGVQQALGFIGFSATCLLVGAIYGISFRDIYVIGLIGMPFGYVFGPIGMIIQDNLGNVPQKTRRLINRIMVPSLIIGAIMFFVPQKPFEFIVPAFPQLLGGFFVINVLGNYYRMLVLKKLSPKFGKFRPFVIVGGLPTIVCVLLIAFLPFGDMEYKSRLWVLQLLFHFYNTFVSYIQQKDNIENVITPNTQERTKIIAMGNIIAVIIPGIIMMGIPVLAMYTGGMASLNTYRYVLPGVVVLFTPLVLFQAFGVKDRVVIEREHRPEVSMRRGFKAVLKNKYLWILNISGILGAVSWGSINLLNIIIIYGMRQDWLLGIMATAVGISGAPGNLFLPFIVKRLGKRNAVLMARGLQYISFVMMYFAVAAEDVYLLFFAMFVGNIFGTVSWMGGRTMTPDAWDYQQYISRERLEGCANIFSLITNPITTLLAMIVPAVYAAIGFSSDWNVMYFPEIRNKVFMVTLALSVLGHTLGTIPLFFYDLSDKKHGKIIEELRRRADELDRLNTGDGSMI
jgi:Na+/melibiose symporter-like transporter